MNPLTQEQINIAQSFNEQQKKDYALLRSAGMPIQEAFTSVVSSYSPEKVETYQKRLEGQDKTLLESVVGGVGEALTGGIRETGEIAKQYGTGEAIRRLPLSLVAGAGRGVGQVFGAGLETIDDLTGERISGALEPMVQELVQTPTGQRIIQGAERLDIATKGVAGDILDVSNLVGLGLLKAAPARALRQSIISKTKGLTSKVTTATKGKSLKEVLRKPFQKTVEVPTTVKSPVTFSEAVNVGFKPQEARLFANFTDPDTIVAKNMLKLSDDISLGKVDATTRPIDLVGNNAKTQLKSMETIEKTLGKNVDEAAKTLENLPINETELKTALLKTVDDYKIKRTNKRWDFLDSDFALTKNVQEDIEEALNFVFSPKKDAYAVHRIKKTLDGLIYPQKVSEGLSGQAKNLIKKLRRNVDDYLDNNFTAYKVANEDFSRVKNVLEEARDVLGDFNEANLANKIRSVFSNSPKREQFKTVLNKLDDLAKEKGLPDVGNLYNQALFAEKLIDLFGDNAVTGFGESIKRAISRTQAIAEGLRNPIAGAGKIAGEIVEKVAGQSADDQLQFLKKILNYED